MTQRYRSLQTIKAWNVLCCLLFVLILFNSCFSDMNSKVTNMSKGLFDGLSTTMSAERYLARMLPDLAYGPLPDEKLDLCQPKGVASLRPAVVLIHGGGWVSGDKQEFDGLCMMLARHGFVAATVRYRLAISAVATTYWPAQIVDVQLAVRWLRAMAPSLQVDPRRVCAWGDSAGGHLAVYLGTHKTIHEGDVAASQALDISPHVSCVVDEFGPVDLTESRDAPLEGDLLTLFGGTSYKQNPELYRDFSPAFAVTSQSAPMLIVQGMQDTLVPPTQSAELHQALKQYHVPVWYLSYNGGHGFSELSDAQRQKLLAQEVNYLIMLEHP